MTVFVRRVLLKNYKSIEACDVELSPLTFLVGPNGSGKSNFLDALGLVGDASRGHLTSSIQAHGGIGDVRRRAVGHARGFGMRLDIELAGGIPALYAFEIEGVGRGGGFRVVREVCRIGGERGKAPPHWFDLARGDKKVFTSSLDRDSDWSPDSLGLAALSGWHPAFRDLVQALAGITVYDIEPDRMREVLPPDPGVIMLGSGRNVAGVWARLEAEAPETARRISDYLHAIVPDIIGVEHVAVADREALRFRQRTGDGAHEARFYASSMSDGTLRALGLLIALFQSTPNGAGHVIPLVGLEEPESALHPAALAVLLDALREASHKTQVIVTSHSPHLLDREDIAVDQIIAVRAEGGRTVMGGIDEPLREMLRDKLTTPGELLGQGQLHPRSQERTLTANDIDLFPPLEIEG